jgi:hypothetical protein
MYYKNIMKPHILYKVHGTTGCDQLQVVTRYVYYIGHDLRPDTIVERCFPGDITILPTIVLRDKTVLEGLNTIVAFYEEKLKVTNLLSNSMKFNELNPGYKITDRSTHKNVISI